MTKQEMIEKIKESLSSLEYDDLLERAETFAQLWMDTLTDAEVKTEYDCEFEDKDDDEEDECKGCEHADCATCPYYTEEDAT